MEMRYKVKVNPVDLQDRDAFLAFLHEQSEKGYQAVRVLPTHTYFKKIQSEKTYYTLAFDSEEAAGNSNLYAMNNGIIIRPASDWSGDPAWCEKVLANYSRFTQFRRSRLLGHILQIFPTLILLTPGIYLLNLFGTLDQFTELTDMIRAIMVVLGGIAILQAIQLAIHLFSWYIDNLHLKEMRNAAALKQPYRTPQGLVAKVRVKNGLSCYCYGLVLIMELLYIIFLLVSFYY